jgi:hypothetical protein
MRIRINSHTSEASPKDDQQTDPVVPGSAGDVNGEATSVDQSPSETSGVTAVSGKTGTNGTNGHSDAKPSIISKKLDDQTGKVMTILSSDLKSIQWGQRWLQPCTLSSTTICHPSCEIASLLLDTHCRLLRFPFQPFGMEVRLVVDWLIRTSEDLLD